MTQSDQLSAEDLLSYMHRTSMQYAYKALLAVQMAWSGDGTLTTRDFAGFLYRFYRERDQRGLRLEKPEKQPVLTEEKFRLAVDTPCRLFREAGFLVKDGGELHIWRCLSKEDRSALYQEALDRLAAHYQEPRELVEELMKVAGQGGAEAQSRPDR